MTPEPTNAEAQDLAIVELSRSGPPGSALARFLDVHGPRLAAACRRLAGSSADGEDLLQETLFQVDRSLPAFRGESALYSWAFRIAVHLALNRRRGLAARATHVALGDAMRDLVAGADDGGDPDLSCIAAYRARVVERALLALPEGQRLALTLYDLEEMTAVETGAALGIAPNAVKQRVLRARRALRERIASELAKRGLDFDAGLGGCVSGLFAHVAAPPSQSTTVA